MPHDDSFHDSSTLTLIDRPDRPEPAVEVAGRGGRLLAEIADVVIGDQDVGATSFVVTGTIEVTREPVRTAAGSRVAGPVAVDTARIRRMMHG